MTATINTRSAKDPISNNSSNYDELQDVLISQHDLTDAKSQPVSPYPYDTYDPPFPNRNVPPTKPQDDRQWVTENGAASINKSLLRGAYKDDSVGVYFEEEDVPPGWRHELGHMFSIGVPVALTTLFRTAISVTDTALVGHLDSADNADYLAAAALSNVWMSMTFMICIRGFGDALNVLCGQALGAKNYELVGLWLQQAIIWVSLFCIPIAALWVWATGPLLSLVGISGNVLSLTILYTRISVMWLWPALTTTMLQRFFQAQKIVMPSLYTNFVFVWVNLALNYILIFGIPGVITGLGFIGSPLATGLSRWGQMVFYVGYTVGYKKYHQPVWGGWNLRRAMRVARIKEYLLRQALPTICACALEEYQLEIISLFAAYLGTSAMASLSASLQLYFFLSSFMFGLTAANNVTVSTYLGSNMPRKARAASVLAFKVAFCIGVFIGSMFYFTRNVVGKLFSPSQEVQDMMAQSALILGICYLGLSVFYAAMSAIQATGRPHLVALAFLVGAWGFAVPLSYYLAFMRGYGLLGLWYGLCCGYMVVTIMVAVVYYRTDFHEMARGAIERSARAETQSFDEISAVLNTMNGHDLPGRPDLLTPKTPPIHQPHSHAFPFPPVGDDQIDDLRTVDM
eukprot:gb/GEZN01001650.1/.p1 GENE.gb/GEZN01001650.1/~~gb/GEZN01001650.1/.p1  ORF type:complete len:627 (+),score=59.58 gb/GEZN01001650.1/:277-2157(+)